MTQTLEEVAALGVKAAERAQEVMENLLDEDDDLDAELAAKTVVGAGRMVLRRRCSEELRIRGERFQSPEAH